MTTRRTYKNSYFGGGGNKNMTVFLTVFLVLVC